MPQVITAENITLSELTEIFGLTITNDEQFFPECLNNLPEITPQEKLQLDRVKSNYLNLINRHPLSENLVKMVIVEHLLDLAGFYQPPFDVKDEKSVEISVSDQDVIIRGRIDFLVIKNQLWVVIIESKNAGISIRQAIPQALAYMLKNPQPEQSSLGLVTNGDNFVFIKLTQQDTPKYALSEQFTLIKRDNELYKVLSILKKLGQIIAP